MTDFHWLGTIEHRNRTS